MHDVGKIYVDKYILIKPGKLSEEEFQKIKMHTVFGEKIVGDSEYLKMSAEIARYHHEKYDALRRERSYKPAFTHQKAYKIIIEGDGRVNPDHFDPKVLEAFKKNHSEFNDICEELAD